MKLPGPAGVPLGPRQAAVLAHLEEHPGLTAGELARVFGLSTVYELLYRLEQLARVVAVTTWEPHQGRHVARWHVAPPGTVPAPPRRQADPESISRHRECDRVSHRARRARARGPVLAPGMEPPSLRDVPAAAADLPGAACRTTDPGLFFPPDLPEAEHDRVARAAKAKAVCAGCPVRTGCYAAAAANGETSGIWGGVDFADRKTAGRKAS